jgi:hypothetical protein
VTLGFEREWRHDKLKGSDNLNFSLMTMAPTTPRKPTLQQWMQQPQHPLHPPQQQPMWKPIWQPLRQPMGVPLYQPMFQPTWHSFMGRPILGQPILGQAIMGQQNTSGQAIIRKAQGQPIFQRPEIGSFGDYVHVLCSSAEKL